MVGVQKTTEMASSLFHIGGLSGAAVLLAEHQKWEAFELALVATACVLLLTGAVALAEIGRVKVRQFVRKHEERPSPMPRGKEGPDA